jgi:hypothetical protein
MGLGLKVNKKYACPLAVCSVWHSKEIFIL